MKIVISESKLKELLKEQRNLSTFKDYPSFVHGTTKEEPELPKSEIDFEIKDITKMYYEFNIMQIPEDGFEEWRPNIKEEARLFTEGFKFALEKLGLV